MIFCLQKMCPHLALRLWSTISAARNICGNFELKVSSCKENGNILFWLDSFPRTPSPQNGRKLGARSYLKKSSPSMMGRSLDVQTYAGSCFFFVFTNWCGQLSNISRKYLIRFRNVLQKQAFEWKVVHVGWVKDFYCKWVCEIKMDWLLLTKKNKIDPDFLTLIANIFIQENRKSVSGILYRDVQYIILVFHKLV